MGGEIGDILLYKDCDSTDVEAGPSGSAVNWDFSNLSTIDNRYEMVVSPSQSPYANQFPGTNYCRNIYSGPGTYNHYLSTSEALYYLGFSTSTFFLKYDDPQKLIEFPFTYNDSFVDTTILMTETFIETSYLNTLADAYGIVTLPNGTYENVLRIKTTAITIDSSFLTGEVTNSNLIEYNYYSQDVVGPLLIISERSNDAGPIFKVVFYNYDPITTLQTNDLSSFEVFPNPCKKEFFVTVPERFITENPGLMLLDMHGQTVIDNYGVKSNQVLFDVSHLSSGVYILSIYTQTSNEIKLILVE